MSRYDGPLIDQIPDSRYLEAKRLELAELGPELCIEKDDPTTKALIQSAAQALALTNEAAIESIQDLAMCINEDVALLANDVLTAICFCFPSSWVPAQRLGMPLAQIHHPVADGEKLVNASPKIAHIMSDLQQGSFRRFVWTITNSSNLSQHPKRKLLTLPEKIEDLYYRLETQTTLPVMSNDGRASLFLVKVELCPLSVFWENAQQRSQICASIDSMSKAVLEYKNLQHIKKLLCQ